MLKRALLPVLLAVACTASAKPADVALSPTDKQAETAAWVAQLLSNSRFHYKPQPLDDALSEKIFDGYMDSLDADRAFFLKGDVDKFMGYRTSFDDALRNRRLQPAFDIFNVYL